ncbi:MAG: DUF4129 domain-containing protein [Anaerolineae bacterium]|nr:DUF4129 domain-containing protein [Anaerolineae bacterium]
MMRRETIFVALAAAEVSWLAPVLLMLAPVIQPHPPLLLWLGLLVLLLAFAGIYRALVAAELPMRVQQGLAALALLAAMALMLRYHVYASLEFRGTGWFLGLLGSLGKADVIMPVGWVAIMFLVYLWVRALALARRSLSAGSVGFSFRAGVVILIGVGLVTHLIAGVDASPFVVAFFFFSLVAVALARIEAVSRLPNSTAVPFDSFWVGATALAVLALVLLGLLVSVFFYGSGLRQVLAWLWPVWLVIQIVIAGAGALVLWLVQAILSFFSLDISFLGQGLREALLRMGEMLTMPAAPPPPSTERPAYLGIVQVALMVGLPLVIVILVLLWTWGRQLRWRRGQADGVYESIFDARELARRLRAMLRGGLDRLGDLADTAARFGLGTRFLAAISIRRIYTNLLRLAADAGYPRATSQTPYEYLNTLRRALPDNEADAQTITEAYVNARYGQVPDTREELERIRACWQRIRAEGIEKHKETG